MRLRSPRAVGALLAAIVMSAAPTSATPETERDSVEADERWLPVPEEDLESVEALEEERRELRSGALLRGAITRGRFRLRRVGIELEAKDIRGEIGFLEDRERLVPGARVLAGRGRLRLAGGRVSISRAPPLFAEAMRMTRGGRRVPAPRSGVIAAAPSLGASAGAIDGGAVTWSGAASAWGFGGVRGDAREPIGGAGFALGRGRAHALAAVGAAGSTRVGSVTMLLRDRARIVSLEVLGSDADRALLAEVVARGNAALLSARWRYRSWTERKVAAELTAETLGEGKRARLSWRSWSGGATADDGLLELEAVASHRGGIRLGAVGLGRDGSPAPAREGYGVIDATLARDAGRSLAVHAMRRASRGAIARMSSLTMGTRLDVRAGRIGEHSLVVESTRLRSGASAWGVELTPSGVTTLRARSRSGMRVAARGAFGTRGFRFGYALERGEEEGTGPRPWSGTLWLRLGPSGG